MSDTKKRRGAAGEKIALQHYLDRGYTLIQKNYTKRGGEIDLILTQATTTIFVEVKVVNQFDSLMDYITPQKLQNLQKTIEAYTRKHNVKTSLRVDVVFVKWMDVIEVFENIALGE